MWRRSLPMATMPMVARSGRVLVLHLGGGDVERVPATVDHALDHGALLFERAVVIERQLQLHYADDHGMLASGKRSPVAGKTVGAYGCASTPPGGRLPAGGVCNVRATSST